MVEYLPLRLKDRVALVCTGSVCRNKEEVLGTSNYLASTYGLESVFNQETYLPLPAERRAEIFFETLKDDSIKAVWALRGGEGSADLIPYFESRAHLIKKCKPKLLLGFSDFTAILLYFSKRFNWPAVHAPSARQFFCRTVDNFSEKILFDWLFQRKKTIEISESLALNNPAKELKKVEIQIVGGNLTLLELSLKEVWEFDFSGKFLLIEEVNEQPYEINRSLKHLHRIGFFDAVKGVFFAGCDFSSLMQRVLTEFANKLQFPVFYTSQIGHGMKNLPVPFFQSISVRSL